MFSLKYGKGFAYFVWRYYRTGRLHGTGILTKVYFIWHLFLHKLCIQPNHAKKFFTQKVKFLFFRVTTVTRGIHENKELLTKRHSLLIKSRILNKENYTDIQSLSPVESFSNSLLPTFTKLK